MEGNIIAFDLVVHAAVYKKEEFFLKYAVKKLFHFDIKIRIKIKIELELKSWN